MALYIGYEPVGQEFESLRAHHKNQALTVINRKGFFVLSISLPILSPLFSDTRVNFVNLLGSSKGESIALLFYHLSTLLTSHQRLRNDCRKNCDNIY